MQTRTLTQARERRCAIGEHVWKAGECRICHARRWPEVAG